MNFREARDIVDDTEKGAAELAADAARSVGELEEEEAVDYLKELLEGRAVMSPLVNLANDVFLALEKGEDHRKAAEDFLSVVEKGGSNASQNCDEILKENEYRTVLTLSYSSTVIGSLKNTGRVIVLESRPAKEGRKTAEILAREGVEVECWVDAGMGKALEKTDAVVVGADTVAEDGFLNKLGTKPLSICAEAMNIPFYVVCDSSKILPRGIPAIEGEQHPVEEVWSLSDVEGKNHITVMNDYFEFTGWDEQRLITEDGLVEDIKTKVKEKEVSKGVLRYHPARE